MVFGTLVILIMWVYPSIYFYNTLPVSHMMPLRSQQPLPVVCLLAILDRDFEETTHGEIIYSYPPCVPIESKPQWWEDITNNISDHYKSLFEEIGLFHGVFYQLIGHKFLLCGLKWVQWKKCILNQYLSIHMFK